MPVLDRSRDFAEIHGAPSGVKYEQDGRCFNLRGEEVDVMGRPVRIETPKPESKPSEELDGKHWKHLRAMVELYGGTWTNKADAIAFLQGQSV